MTLLLSTFYYFYFSIIGVYIIFFPKVLLEVGYSASEIGIILAASPLVRFILPFLFMRGLEINRRLFNLSLVIVVASAASFFVTIESFYTLLVSNIFLGLGLSLLLPYIEVVALETIGKERYGRVRLFGSIGFMVVALILAKLLSSADIALMWLLVLAFVTSVCAFFIGQKSHTEHPKEQSKEHQVISLVKDWHLWLGLTLMQMSFGSFYNFFTIYETAHGLSLDMTVYLWSFGVLAEILMLFFQGKILQGNLAKVLEFTTFITALRWLLVYLYPENLPLMFFAQSLHAFSFALFHSTAISYLFELYANRRLAQQFFSGITYGLGGLGGALLAGYIYEYYAEYLFLSSAVIALLAASVLYKSTHLIGKKR